MLSRLGIFDRSKDLVEKLSGGLKRRVELAKGLLHNPKILIMDEPSTGLDPGSRMDLWKYLKSLREKDGVTILVTTHLMEEADKCDRLGIMNEGKVVSVGTPAGLKSEIGGDVVLVKTSNIEELQRKVEEKFKIKTLAVEGGFQIEHPEGHRFVPDLVEAFPGELDSVTFHKPTLEDVFIHKTGHQFWEEND